MTLTALSALLGGQERGSGCGCRPAFDGETLTVRADRCEAGGRLESNPECRAAVISALVDRDCEHVVVSDAGLEARYEDAACALLVAAGRFVEAVRDHEERLASLARRDPLAAAREANGRVDAVSDIAAEVGLLELAALDGGYESRLAPTVGLAASDWRVESALPPDARLVETRILETDATVRRYVRPDGRDRYMLEPAEHELDRTDIERLARAYQRLADGHVDGGSRAPSRAVRDVAPDAAQTGILTQILRKHTQGYGLLTDLFADEKVSEVFLTAPVTENPVRVRVDGDNLVTNVRLSGAGIEALASRFRAESGRAFSRANPTLETAVTLGDRRVRVTGVTEPASDGTAFAFRAHDRNVWTLPTLVANDTLTPSAAALLSLAVKRGRSLLITGPRGAGKTTLLGALLWELPPPVRTLVIEDTPELSVRQLQSAGRDVQALRTGDEREIAPDTALRTALRLGDSALVLGEIRGEEARVLYEAMRVGANSEAVLGTIHGDGAAATYERVVSDLGVPPSSFCVTDAIVTLEVAETADQPRRVRTIEEVVGREEPRFERLYGRQDGTLTPTGRIDRGNSRLLLGMARPEESVAAVRTALAERVTEIDSHASHGQPRPDSQKTGYFSSG